MASPRHDEVLRFSPQSAQLLSINHSEMLQNEADRRQNHAMLLCGGNDDTRRQAAMTQLRIALYQPDIAGNTGTILRLAACLGLGVDIIEPAGFDVSDRNLKRAGMDYIAAVSLNRHVNWERFDEWRISAGRRLVLASTKAAERYTDFTFSADDVLLFGRESAGVPDHVHDRADGRIIIPMVEGQRSINVAMSAAMIAGEAMRQTVFARKI